MQIVLGRNSCSRRGMKHVTQDPANEWPHSCPVSIRSWTDKCKLILRVRCVYGTKIGLHRSVRRYRRRAGGGGKCVFPVNLSEITYKCVNTRKNHVGPNERNIIIVYRYAPSAIFVCGGGGVVGGG